VIKGIIAKAEEEGYLVILFSLTNLRVRKKTSSALINKKLMEL
jgi:hypothetical protein